MEYSNKTQYLLHLLFLLAWVSRATGYALIIGAVLDTRSRIGKEQMVALEVAARNFNTSSQVLLLNTTEVKSTDPLQAASSAQQLIQQGAQVIISTGTWPQVLGISDVGKPQQVPTISLTPSVFLNKTFLVQMSYPDSALVNCLAAIVKSYNWRRVIVVYEDDDYGTVSGTALLLSYALQDIGVQIDYSLVFPPMDSELDVSNVIKKERREVISTVYIILRMSENLVKSFFKDETVHKRLHNGSAWICSPDVTTLLDSTLDSSFVEKYMQGVIGVQPYVNESATEYTKFSNSFQKAFKNQYDNKETTFNPGVYASRAYDAMYAVTLAANKAKMDDSSLVKSMLEINFEGLSGLVTPFKNEGINNERNRNSIFRIINVVGKSYKGIGFWSNSSGFCTESQLDLNASSSLKQLNVLPWPGELATKTPPAGVRKLKIGVLTNTTWGEPKTIEINGATINVTSISGFCIDVFKSAMRKFNQDISYAHILYSIDENFTYDKFVNKVYEEVDIAVGDVTVTSNRMENVSFTEPFIASGVSTIVPLKRDNISLMLLKPFTPNLWIAIFLLLFFNFGVIWYLERNDRTSGDDFRGPWYTQFGATFWIIGNTFFQSIGDKIGSFYSKTVIVSWLVVVLIVSSCFTANLSSILVANQLKPVVDTSRIGCDGDSFVEEYLKKALNFNGNIIVPMGDPHAYSDAFEKGNITAAYIESTYVPEFLSKNKNYGVYGETQMLGGFAFVLRKGDPMRADLSKAIVKLQEDGTINTLQKEWFSATISSIGTVTNTTDSQRLGLGEFWSLLVFSAGVSFITLAAFITRKHVVARRENKKIIPSSEEETHGSTLNVLSFEEEMVIVSQVNKLMDHQVNKLMDQLYIV